MKKRRKMLTIVCVMAVSLLAVSCQQALRPETVLLQGAVTIGPISLVEKPGEYPPVSPDVFTDRKLLIYDESGKHLVREAYFTQIGNGATGYTIPPS